MAFPGFARGNYCVEVILHGLSLRGMITLQELRRETGSYYNNDHGLRLASDGVPREE